MARTLNTQNPEYILYKYDEIQFTILGGINLHTLDRMRITLKSEFKNEVVRHTADLYNDAQAEKLVRKLSEKLEIGHPYISKAITELTGELETYRLEEIDKNKDKGVQVKQLTDKERQEAENFLKQPELLQQTNKLIGQSGVIGEEQNRLLMYLIFTSRKRYNPLHVISLAASGTGKSYLQEKVSELIPEEDKIEMTVLSENAFYYFGQRELKHKLILIEDLDGAENALYPLRELQSKKRISKTIAYKDAKGNTKTQSLTVEGPVSVAGCTTQEQIYEDNANRSFLIYLDDSKEQDTRIMAYQRLLSAGKINTTEERKIKELLKNTQRVLQPVTVVNPYAEYLHIPQEVFKPRRTNTHYLNFIEAITFYKQYQREAQPDEETGELCIYTTTEDIEEANELLKEILLRKSDELNGACRNYFEKLKQYTQQNEIKEFTSKEISRALRIPVSTVKRYHLQLVNTNYLKHEEQKNKKQYTYQIVSYEEYKDLQSRITTALDEALNKVKELNANDQPNGSLSAHKTSEPQKPKRNKANSVQPTQPTEKDNTPNEINEN